MSLNAAVEYEFDCDNKEQQNSYPSLSSENIVINDSNQGNYLNHWINFNSNGLTGKDSVLSKSDLFRLRSNCSKPLDFLLQQAVRQFKNY
jgi:hypothetical protein